MKRTQTLPLRWDSDAHDAPLHGHYLPAMPPFLLLRMLKRGHARLRAAAARSQHRLEGRRVGPGEAVCTHDAGAA